MNTILTKSEREEIFQQCADADDEVVDRYGRAVEAVVLAKLREQEPVEWWCMREFEQGLSFAKDQDPHKDWQPLYANPASQQADRQRVTEGHVLVPVEPTPEMMVAAQEADMDHGDHDEWLEYDGEDVKRIHRAMLAAAPEATAQEIADVWHEGSRSFYRAVLLKKLALDEVFFDPAGSPEAPAQASAVDERAEFEAWWEKQTGFAPQRDASGDGYVFSRTEHQWDAWQARAALAQKGGQ